MQTKKTLRIQKDLVVHAGSADDLFSLALTNLESLTDYMPDIRSIKPIHKTSSQGTVIRTDRWVVEANVPKLLRKAIGAQEIAFVTVSSWCPRTNSITWTIRVEGFDAYITGEGLYRFLAGDGKTRIDAEILLHLDLGASRILRSTIGRLVFSQLEKFAAAVVAMKLSGIAHAIEQFVADRTLNRTDLSALPA
ncbi:MAG: hypothetical protein HYT87_12730 [Nitrospirae bacterium]|nr:hypothetical protein [Nitrospirota bacterium]